ncbi:hypothetical protein KCG44_01375 [Pacificimonas sp. WHA3]|uniref:DUF4071 domain-containing protein n=1 Tax=Pacificimonas pallii TaxID=2827236 RepID=A0ABS6SAJ7_9SPHN|nr:tetratricopeptide repeat-containing protein [Pacificimonas pallii]MBV7255428.1 hypothetical protein [Pacificimonas pallii]
MNTASLLALIRAGATARAWDEFTRLGLDQVRDEPSVLTLHGRLLKERAREHEGDAKRRGFLSSAEMYANAAELENTTYPLINAASLSLLGGDERRAKVLAELTLERLDDPSTDSDTPYYVAATRAEAYLLLGHQGRARDELMAAIERAPKAFEDHATTLRQFTLLLEHMELPTDWLDEMRPPPSMTFAGHMSISEEDEDAVANVRRAVQRSGAKFGYGALAAGADILVAEALLAENAALTVILPGEIDAFRAASVTSRGDAWGKRFDRLIRDAEDVVIIPNVDGVNDDLAIRLAGEVAMGMAARHAALIEANCCQLLVLREDELEGGGMSGVLGRMWRDSGREQHIVESPGKATRYSLPSGDAHAPRLAAAVEIDLGGTGVNMDLLSDGALAKALAGLPGLIGTPSWRGAQLSFAYQDPVTALAAAKLLISTSRSDETRAAFDYGIARCVDEPLGGTSLLAGSAVHTASEILATVPAGASYASGAFFYALVARTDSVRGELMGEFETELQSVELYALLG